MAQDRYGLSLSTGFPAAAEAYVDGVDRLLGGHEGAEECFIVAATMGAFAKGDYEAAITARAPVLDQFVRVGGSRAQRDLFEHTLLAAYLRVGRCAEADALLRRRVDRPPSVPVART